MDSGTNHVVRNVDNAGGDSSTSANHRLTGSVAEEVVFTTTTSGTSVIRAGWSELHAFPRTVTDLGATNIEITSATLQWTTPGYDGQNGTLQVGSTYYIRVASYTVPDTFSDYRLANISFSTSGVIPGEVVSINLMGLQLGSGTTYYARIWTTDGDSDISYQSNISSFVLKPTPAPLPPTGGSIVAVFATSATATWAPSLGASSYLMIASTQASFVPVFASSSTAASTGTVSGLDPNTTYFFEVDACALFCSSFISLGSTITAAAPALSLSTTGVSSSTIFLAWNPNGNPPNTRYVVQSSTDNLTFLSVATVTTTTAGLLNVLNDTTYYLKVVALNHVGTPAAPSNLLTVRTPIGPIPFAPTGVSATAILLGAAVTWDALTPAGVGVGLLYYRVSRSTNAGYGFVTVTTTTAISYLDRPMVLGDTYYYKISARDSGQVEGPFSALVYAFPFTYTPMEPLGVHVVPAPLNVTLSWSRTTRYADGTVFLSTSTPLPDELIGYSIFRSTEACAPSFINISSLPYTTTNLVNVTGGLHYYYRLFSYNTLGLSSNAVTLSSLGDRSYFIDDCVSKVVMDDATAVNLNSDVNGQGDIQIDRRRVPEDVHDGVYQSVIFRPMRGTTELSNFPMTKPVRIVLHFETQNGVPFAPAVAAAPAGGLSVKNLGLYWYNGQEFKKVYGVVDPITQTVTVQSPNLGKYQIRALSRADGTTFDLSNISGRAITPNGDGLNDIVIFTYDPGPGNESVSGRIYDVMGAYVSDMTAGLVPNTLIWNGRSGGRVVGSGAYVYSIKGGGKTYTGTIVVAR